MAQDVRVVGKHHCWKRICRGRKDQVARFSLSWSVHLSVYPAEVWSGQQVVCGNLTLPALLLHISRFITFLLKPFRVSQKNSTPFFPLTSSGRM